MMTMDFSSFMFMLLVALMVSSAVTSAQNPNVTDPMVRNTLKDQEATSLTPPIVVSGLPTQAPMVEEKTENPSAKPVQPTTVLFKTLSPKILTTATNIQTSQLKTTTMGEEFMTVAATVVISTARNPIKTTRTSSMPDSSTQSQDTSQTSASNSTSETTAQTSKRPTESTKLSSTMPASTKFQSTGTGTGGDATESTSLFRTSKAATNKPFIQTTKAKEGQDTQKKSSSDSKVVAGIIGGALVLMMVGFLAIYIKKRKLQRQQITTTDWAGPSPFLDGGADNGQVTLRSSNRISLSSFLPQRLSKRLSLLQETDEEMEDMTPGSTFGNQIQGTSFGREADGKVKESNGTAGAKEEMKSTEDNQESVKQAESSSQTKDPLNINNNTEDAKPGQDPPASPPTPPNAGENGPVELDNGLGQP
ncbi:protein EVI2B isoform X1 [Cheilinus undulatus]|uniref:protein EVI2B isoform X1 n=1 Tax=Cheilinus undulatus TaxID=241271 RepID=UPI001BD5F724|nr:protein EVI2B isoform X1 [Cheilinus undulatus]